MQRVVIHLCSPLLCQRSWLQRQLLKDGMILVTICVGIVSVQHQVPTTSLSLGIVMKAELSYRLLVTLLFASEQQWGSFNIGHSVTLNVTFPIAFVSSFYAGTTQSSQTISHDQYNNGNKITSVTLSSMTIRNNEQGGLVYWMAIGK